MYLKDPGGGGGLLGVRTPLLEGKNGKEGKNVVPMRANTCVLIFNSHPDSPPPVSCIHPCLYWYLSWIPHQMKS